jgi:hypothetical protein
MYSCEQLFAVTGDPKWAERLEVLAFNALPATISDDMWTHQYVQMSNQIACQRFPGKSFFRTNNREAHLFGLEPNFGCCTANFNQGWPKLALSTFMYNGSTVINAVPVPAELKTPDQTIRLETAYPFGNAFRYSIEARADFDFQIRIPSFARQVRIDGQEFFGSMASFRICAGEARTILVEYSAAPRFETRPYNLYTVKCGSLVFSLPISFEKEWKDNPCAENYYENVERMRKPEINPYSRVEYREGLFVGYRGYEKNGVEPLFPFGFGLSYTTFEYSDLQIVEDGGEFVVNFKVANTGKYAGAEVAQVYVGDDECRLIRPAKELKGFDKIHLNPGEAKTVSVRLDEEAFRYYDPIDRRFVVEPGTFTVHVGASSADIRLTGKLEVPSGKY